MGKFVTVMFFKYHELVCKIVLHLLELLGNIFKITINQRETAIILGPWSTMKESQF